MTRSLVPFGLLPPALLPGWLLPGSGGVLLYRGCDGPASIDWLRPVGFAQPGAGATATAPGAAPAPGKTCHYAVCVVGDSGVEARSTHVQCAVRLEGDQPRPMLPVPMDLHLRRRPDGLLEMAWRLTIGVGHARPDRVEVVRDDGSGGWDQAHPLRVLATAAHLVADCAVMLPVSDTRQYAVRACLGEHVGALSAAASLPAVPPPPAVVLF